VTDRPIRVFLLDDHEVVRRGLHELLSLEDDIEVVGEGASVQDGITRIPLVSPDVAVLDVRLPDGSGIEVCRELPEIAPDVRALMLTSYADDEALVESVLAGAAGYMLKDIRGGELVEAVRTVAAGRSLVDPADLARVRRRLTDHDTTDERLRELTDQERRILSLIGEGLTNRQIGERMFLAEKTVKNYVSSILAKLGMERRTQAATFVVRLEDDQ
jgi:DNA-binding NarL/FixJ family response regulator